MGNTFYYGSQKTKPANNTTIPCFQPNLLFVYFFFKLNKNCDSKFVLDRDIRGITFRRK